MGSTAKYHVPYDKKSKDADGFSVLNKYQTMLYIFIYLCTVYIPNVFIYPSHLPVPGHCQISQTTCRTLSVLEGAHVMYTLAGKAIYTCTNCVSINCTFCDFNHYKIYHAPLFYTPIILLVYEHINKHIYDVYVLNHSCLNCMYTLVYMYVKRIKTYT